MIKDVLLKSLNANLGASNDSSDCFKRIRSSLAYAVSAIAHYDWPEEWPQLGTILLEYLSSGNTIAVSNAMKVFVELSNEITDIQIPSVAPLLLPKMYEIFISPQEFSLRTRSRAVKIFITLAETIAQMNEIDQSAIQKYLEPVLPEFTEVFLRVLQLPDSSNEVDVGLKQEIINGLTNLLRNCEKQMKKWVPQILEPVWFCLTQLASIYVKVLVNTTDDYDEDHEHYAEIIDSDGEVLGFENLVFALIDFVSAVIEVAKFRKLIKPVMSDLIYYIIIYMQITDEQARCWIENPDQFVEDEDEDSYSFSIRISAQNLILTLTREFELNESSKKLEQYQSYLLIAINKHLEQSIEMHKNHNMNWWKIQEACLLTIGSISEMFIDTVNCNSSTASSLRAILDTILNNNNLDFSPFLIGRSLWTASRLAEIINMQSIDRFLQLTNSALSTQSPVLQIAGARATWGFCDFIKSKNLTHLIRPYLRSMLEGLIALGTRYSTEVLSLILESLCILCSIDEDFTVSVENIISPLVIATFLKYSSDPVLISIVQDLIAELSKNKNYIVQLQQRLIPTLVSIINPQQPNQFISLQSVSLEILSILVKHSPLPLSDLLMSRGYSACINCVLNNNDDTATLQNGGECVRMFVTKSVDQVVHFHHETSNQNGVALALQVNLIIDIIQLIFID